MDTLATRIREGNFDNLLFHATCEPFEDSPHPGRFDGVLWTAESPVVAQTYIPRSGVTLLGTCPFPYEMEQRIHPEPNSFWYTVARNMGFEAYEVKLDASGSPLSWRTPRDYPTYNDAAHWLRDLGYETNGVIEVNVEVGDDIDHIRPAAWRKPGRLFVTSGEGLNLFDLAGDRDSDLTDPDHLKLDLLHSLEREGYDGVVIRDFLQDKDYGNVGHRSIGLFARACGDREWIETAATNHPWTPSAISTPEWDDLVAALRVPVPSMS